LLFNIFLDFVTKQAASQFASNGRKGGGVVFSFNFQGEPFKVPATSLGELEILGLLLYADDMALLADDEDELNHFVQVLEAVTQRWGLTINVRTTKVWRGNWDKPSAEPTPPAQEIIIRGEALEVVKEFKYLGSTLADTGGLEKELSRRRALAIGKFVELQYIWKHKLISLETKMKFYRAFIPPTLLNGCETWAISKSQEAKLNVVHMGFLRRILGVTIWHRLSNTHVAAKCGIQQVPDLLSVARMRWAGHLCRMGNNRLPRKVLFGALTAGKRRPGRPKKRLNSNYEPDFRSIARANGAAVSKRVTRASARTTGFESWWITARDKAKWRACIDATWP
jgi:hypothetical protein